MKFNGRAAFYIQRNYINNLILRCSQQFVELKKFKINLGPAGISTKSRDVIYDALNDFLLKLSSSGILDRMVQRSYTDHLDDIKLSQVKSGVKIISINDMKAVFLLWCCGCGFAVILMIVERKKYILRKVVKKANKIVRNLLNK